MFEATLKKIKNIKLASDKATKKGWGLGVVWGQILAKHVQGPGVHP